MGFATPRRAEAIVHSFRAFVNDSRPDECRMLLKLNFCKALHTLHWDEMSKGAKTDMLTYNTLLWQCCRNSSISVVRYQHH